ncbi:MAG: hypothetical protein IPP49_07950 [Saprospiraceae bacterium]|nr:hypothetical protein [Saprospiraceae bacterium]
MRSWMIIVVLLVLGQATYSQQSLLQSGPMLGPVTLRDATLWVQTKEDAKVRFDYRVKGSKSSYTLSETVVAKKMTVILQVFMFLSLCRVQSTSTGHISMRRY